jgi:hypothetical protein
LETFSEYSEGSRRLSYLQGEMEPAMSFFPGDALAQTYDRSFRDFMARPEPPTGPLTTQERILPLRTVHCGATEDVQSVRKIVQDEVASLQRQLGEVKRKFTCPLCQTTFSRTTLLYKHIRDTKDENHLRVAAKLKKTSCLICSKEFPRITEVVKHEVNFERMTYNCRAEWIFTLLFPVTKVGMEATKEHQNPLIITSDENFQPHTSIPLTNKAQILNTVELENAACSANLEPASSTSGFDMNMAGGCSTEQGELDSFSTQTDGRRGLIDTFSTNSVDPDSSFVQTEGYRGLIDTFSTNSVDSFVQTEDHRGLIDTFSTNSVGPDSSFIQTGWHQGLINKFSTNSIDSFVQTEDHRVLIDTFSTNSVGPDSSFTQMGGHQGLVGKFSTDSVDPDSYFTQTGGCRDLIDTSTNPVHYFIQTGGHQGLIDTFSINSADPDSSFTQTGGHRGLIEILSTDSVGFESSFVQPEAHMRKRNSSTNEREGYNCFPNEVGGRRIDMDGFPATSGFVWNHGGN